MNGTRRPAGAARSWLLTFSDLIALLLCFFVFQFATRGLAPARWQSVTNNFSATFSSGLTLPAVPLPLKACPAATPRYWAAQIGQRLNRTTGFADAEVTAGTNGVSIALPPGADDAGLLAQVLAPYGAALEIAAPRGADLGLAYDQARQLAAGLAAAGFKAPTRIVTDNGIQQLTLILTSLAPSCAGS